MTASQRRLLIAHALLIGAVTLTFAPLIWMLGVSLKPPDAVFRNPLNPFPLDPTLANYRYVFSKADVLRQLLNSVIFAGGVTLGQLIIAVPAAYAFARWSFRGASVLFSLMLLSLPVPFVVFYVPNYILLSQLDLLNTFFALIVPHWASAYGIFLLRQHFKSFPRSVIDAARIDGAGDLEILVRIILPTARGTIAALAIYVAITTWNEYVWPLLVAPNPKMHTLTVGAAAFAGGEAGTFWGAVMAAALIASAMTLVGYLLARRQILEVLTEGAVK